MTHTPKVGIACFVWRDGKFLMGKRGGAHGANTWSIPGGHLEFGETWQEAAAREVMEETGMKVTNIRLLTVTNDVMTSDNKHYITIWMQADWAANEPAITEPDKFVDQTWSDFQHLPSPLFEPCWQNLRASKPDLF